METSTRVENGRFFVGHKILRIGMRIIVPDKRPGIRTVPVTESPDQSAAKGSGLPDGAGEGPIGSEPPVQTINAKPATLVSETGHSLHDQSLSSRTAL